MPCRASRCRRKTDGRITFADLATHTSGLPLRPTNLPPGNDPANPYAGYSRAALFAFLGGYTLSQEPGRAYGYSNVGFGLLGQALAARAKLSYPELVRRRITAPLGMTDTRIGGFESGAAAIGYDSALKPVPHWDMGRWRVRGRIAPRRTTCSNSSMRCSGFASHHSPRR